MTDLFAGGGGTSTGAALAGVDVTVAVNHWAPSLATHAANHPTTQHENIDISQAEAEEMTRRLAREEGICCGVSAGGAVAAALHVSAEVENAVIVTIICDRGDRYLSTGLFAG